MSDERRSTPGAFLIVAALSAVAVYLNSLGNGFALDDVLIVQTNTRVHDLLDQRSIWLTPYWPARGQELGLYRPGTIFLFAIQWAIGGGAAWVFHAMNIALHALTTALVFLLLDRWTGRTAALAGALLFAVHPVHAEAVANVVGQAELAGAAAVLAACVVHAGRPDQAVSWQRRLVLMLLFAAALMTKESTVVLPALLVLVDLAQRRVTLTLRGVAAYADALLMPLLLLAAVLAGYLILRFTVMGGAVLGVDAAPAMPYLREEYRVLNALRAFPELLRLLFFPLELAADYMPGILLPVEQVRPMVLLGAALLCALTLLALATPWKPAIGFPAAWFLVSIVTVSNLFFPIGVLVAERTLYLPSVALAALIAFAWQRVRLGIPSARRLATVSLALVVVAFAVRTWIRNPDWKDTIAVLNAFVRDHPHSYRAQWSLAASYRAQGSHAAAEGHYRLAVRIYDRDADLLAEFGEFLLAQARIAEAIELLERARAARASSHTVMLLAHAYLVAGRYQDALDLMQDAPQAGIARATDAFVHAAAYEGLMEYDAAVASWRVGIAHSDRQSWRMWSFLARALAAAGHTADAHAALARARTLTADRPAGTMVERLERAVSGGCYAPAAATAAPGERTCDPLGRWVGFAPAAAGAASTLSGAGP